MPGGRNRLTLSCQNPTDWGAKRQTFFHSSGDWKSKIKVSTELVSGEASLPVLTWPFLCMYVFLLSLPLITTPVLLDESLITISPSLPS